MTKPIRKCRAKVYSFSLSYLHTHTLTHTHPHKVIIRVARVMVFMPNWPSFISKLRFERASRKSRFAKTKIGYRDALDADKKAYNILTISVHPELVNLI